MAGYGRPRRKASDCLAKSAVTYLPGGGTIACSRRNISRSGAKLILAEVRSVADQFRLEVTGEPGTRPCIVARRGDTEIGVRFPVHVEKTMAALIFYNMF